MNRLNSEVTVAAAEASPEPSAYPLYVDNMIYLPFARHLAEEDLTMQAEEEEIQKAA